MKEQVKFGIFTDLHAEIMHDAESRLKVFLCKAANENVDFIIHCGDLCYPTDTRTSKCPLNKLPVNLFNALNEKITYDYQNIINLFESYPKKKYTVLGNHEFDFCSLEEVLSAYHMTNPYYSFTIGRWSFICLDGNYYKDTNGNLKHFNHGDYFAYKDLPYLPQEQLDWLDKELNEAENCILFSHQPIFEKNRSFQNQKEILDILDRHSNIKLCISGHLHIDDLIKRKNVSFLTLNSMSNFWAGTEHEKNRLSIELDEKFPNVKYTYPYKDPLFAFVTLNDHEIKIEGYEGAFLPPEPSLGERNFDEHICAKISSHIIKIDMS